MPVVDSAEAVALLRRRGIDPCEVRSRHLARALDQRIGLPRWARIGRTSWWRSGHRLLLPLYDARGRIRSVRAWRVNSSRPPKRVVPAGYTSRGLVLADPVALAILRRGALPDRWPERVRLRVVVAEGEPDFLSWAARPRHLMTYAPAVIGVVSGAWSAEVAGRIPDGALVIVRTHTDETGERYARAVYDSVAGRCEVVRLRGEP